MSRLLLATNNPGKVRELTALLGPRGWTVVTPRDLALTLEPEETGATYAENAAIKAAAFAAAAGLPALADDSGIEVDALGGRPGVYSARYGGAETPHEEKIRLLLGELRDVSAEQRGAHFRSVIVVAAPDGRRWQAEGACDGRIAAAPAGAGGFGYDPIFLMADTDFSRTMAELTEAEKNRLSHRARAVLAAANLLDELRSDPAFA
jgi:XTP/dITP diphosphohydrolase